MCGMPAAIDFGLAIHPRRLGLPLYSIALRSEGVAAARSVPARVVPRTARVRLSDFLATGRLGPVHCGLSRNQVAVMLGPPDGWIEFPAYWCYGKLELSFDPERPHAMHFFQIEFADRLSGDCEVIAGGKIVLELEGLQRQLAPHGFSAHNVGRHETCACHLFTAIERRVICPADRQWIGHRHVRFRVPGRNRIRPRGTGCGRIPETMRSVCAARQHLRLSETGRPDLLRHEIHGDRSCVSRGHDVRRSASAEMAGPLRVHSR